MGVEETHAARRVAQPMGEDQTLRLERILARGQSCEWTLTRFEGHVYTMLRMNTKVQTNGVDLPQIEVAFESNLEKLGS